jgi:hypothetical protein
MNYFLNSILSGLFFFLSLIVFADQHHDSENSFLITPHLEQSSMSLQALRVAEYIAANSSYGTSLTFALYRDYRLAIHRIYLGNPEEKRQQRLDSKTTKDNSISYGCVNVSNTFYDQVLDRLEINSNSYVYIIPTNLDLLDKLLPLNSSLQ